MGLTEVVGLADGLGAGAGDVRMEVAEAERRHTRCLREAARNCGVRCGSAFGRLRIAFLCPWLWDIWPAGAAAHFSQGGRGDASWPLLFFWPW